MNSKKVIKNASWIIASQIFRAILSLIVSTLTARFLGPSNFGTINYAMSIVSFVIPIMQLGLTSIVVQELINQPKKEGEILGTCILSSFISGLFCVFAVILFVYIANFGDTVTITTTILYSLVILVEAFSIFNYWFQSKLLSKYTSITMLIAYIITSIYKIILLVTKQSVIWFALANVIDFLIINVTLYILYRIKNGQKLTVSFTTFKYLFGKSKYFIISGMMIAIFAQTDRIMLKLMISEEATGLYSACVACAGMTNFIFVAILDSVRPLIFECKKQNNETFEKNMCRTYSIIIYLSLLQSIFIALFPNLIIYILYGESYLVASNALRIITWYSMFSYLGAVRNIWLIAEEKNKLIYRIDVSGALINVILNFILIPNYGIEGAAFASLITQIFTNVIVVAILKQTRINIKFMLKGLSPKYLIQTIKHIKG